MMAFREQFAKQSSIVNVKAGDGKFAQRLINRQERKKAKLNPDCAPTYKLYRGYLS